VDRRSCPNINCLPSKNEIWSAKVADLAHHGARYGSMTGPITTDVAKVRARKREMVQGLIERHLRAYKASGAELIMGSGRFTSPKTLEVSLSAGGTRVLTAERVFLNLGTHPALPESRASPTPSR
jgi:pyruvate/2-oxoglutarate dehydrogenase complex dihydrolipoamide dehydrogenase (E3) component